ncbi:MAG: hypothetical protein ACRDJ2_11185, partial [Actinomycetota bacterium]
DDGTHGGELWQSDGTEEGTVMFKDIAPGPSSGQPWPLAALDGTLFFSADGGTTGNELWATYPVLPPGPCPDEPTSLCVPPGDADFESNGRGVNVGEGDGHVVIRGDYNTITLGPGFTGTLTAVGDENLVRGTDDGDVIAVEGCGNLIRAGAAKDLAVAKGTCRGGQASAVVDGGAGSDRLLGRAHSQILRGGRGNDTLKGGRGADRLLGGRGNDKLLGQRGNDFLRGGRGRNRLYGGLGRDDCGVRHGRDARRGCG